MKKKRSSENLTRPALNFTRKCEQGSGILHPWTFISAHPLSNYCALHIFQKVVFCLTLYTEEVNLQTFVMI